MHRLLLALCVFLLALSAAPSCHKNIEEDLYIDTVITGNDIPPYDGVTDVEVANYINKIFIDLLGREPFEDELNDAFEFLEANDLSMEARDTLIHSIQGTQTYYDRLFANASDDFINAADSTEIAYQILLIEFVWYLDSVNGNIQNYIYYETELNKLYDLQKADDDYLNGTITLNEFYARFINNYFYDQVNMGSENFVKGSFDDLYRRTPTEAELANGVSMVDNAPSVLFLQNGDSKGDYVTIVTTCDEFYEGLAKKSYQQLLIREPSSEESAEGIELLIETGFPAFQKSLLKSDEYAGWE